jgi:hypothetical protein
MIFFEKQIPCPGFYDLKMNVLSEMRVHVGAAIPLGNDPGAGL